MTRTAIVGAGPVGRTLAGLLAEQGHHVVLLSRSGRPSPDGRVRSVAVAADVPADLRAATRGVQTIFNCANPSAYTQWAAQWPPLAASILAAATAHGADLVTMGNL